MQERFSIGNSVNFSWEAFKNNAMFLVVSALLLSIIQGIPNSISSSISSRLWYLQTVMSIITWILSLFVAMAWIRVGLKLVSQETPDFPDLYLSYDRFVEYLAGSVIYFLIVFGGLLLLIVPGIYWAIKYQFYGFFILDQDMSAMDSIKRSGELTKGEMGNLFVFWLAMAGIMILGVLACCVGILVATPVVNIARAYIFRSLLATEQSQPQAVQPPPAMQPPQPTGPPTQPPVTPSGPPTAPPQPPTDSQPPAPPA